MNKNRRILIFILSFVIIASGIILGFSLRPTKVKSQTYDRTLQIAPEHNFNDISNPFSNTVKSISYTEFRATIATQDATPSQILNGVSGLKIRIDTARELHRFSQDVSPFEDLNYKNASTLMTLDYVLGNDINYAEVTGNRFIPIGYFYEQDNILKQSTFSGTFDGQGFEIKNLYMADYQEIVIITDEADIATTPYYAMFAFSSGEIMNFGLVDPHYEIMLGHENITKAAHIVGENTGMVENVFVTYSQSNFGIRMRTVTGQTVSNYEAGGIVYYNKDGGKIENVYYAGDAVIDPIFIVNFKVQPVVYKCDDPGDVENANYDQDRYLLSVMNNGQLVPITAPAYPNTGKTTLELKTNGMGPDWYYYPNYRYPALFGLEFDGEDYLINDVVEFIYFNKLINLNYLDNNGINYRLANYILKDNIDMREISPRAYITPFRSFDGTFNGDGKAIGYLDILYGRVSNHEYFAGLFGILGGNVINLDVVASKIDLEDDEAPDYNHHIGFIAGMMEDGIINNVKVSGTIKLNQKIPTTLSAGLLVGDASGLIQNVYVNGDITGNVIYAQSGAENITYNIGGIIGNTGTETLRLDNVLHIGDITGPSSNIVDPFTKPLVVNIGGVIGGVTNAITTNHQFRLISHAGRITTQDLNTSKTNIYVGGVIGDVNGVPFREASIESNRKWTHRGTIYNNITNVNKTTKVVEIAGILNSNLTQRGTYVELRNYDILIGTQKTAFVDYATNKDLIYVPIINSRSTNGIELYQSSNDSRIRFTYLYPYYGAIRTEGESKLKFIENYGTLFIAPVSAYGQINYNEPLTYAAITRNNNVFFENVTQEADITIYSLNNTNTSSTNFSNMITVAGITTEISPNKYIKNSYNKGKIIIANIQNQYSNIYVAGLVNHNKSGDLHTQGSSLQPKATVGVINSVNYGDISSTYNSGLYGIHGRGNTYVGGLVTSNQGSIQDSINHGKLTIYNSFVRSAAEVDPVQFDDDDRYGGRITMYRGGVVIGGVASFIASGNSRVFDTSNGGDIVALSTGFVRTGGIVGIALEQELIAGNAGGYATSNIPDSIISNGINYGTVIGLTSDIGVYSSSTSAGTTMNLYLGVDSEYTRYNRPATLSSTQERPGVHASSGGVIGYGLSEMRRMINHGTIISTDVAGGVVGATFVFNSLNDRYTYVKIDTAINYGNVRAYRAARYNNFDKINFSITQIETNLYDPQDPFIFPTWAGMTLEHLRMFPRDKRGIGGVFGRLQRGRQQYMVGDGTNGSQFDFIVNMDPNVDLIGRLDQVINFSDSLMVFKFGNAKYYTARENDTTQAVFTGFYYREGSYRSLYLFGYQFSQHSPITVNDFTEITYSKYRYYEYNSGNYRYRVRQGLGNEIQYTGNILIRRLFYTAGQVNVNQNEAERYSGGSANPDYNIIWRNLGQPEIISEANPKLSEAYFPSINGTDAPANSRYGYTTVTTVHRDYDATLVGIKEVPLITEDPNNISKATYIYDESFEMRNDKILLANGQPITSYINYAHNEVLGERFTTTRPNGMYVLSSTAGSVYGETLPINTELPELLKLNGNQPHSEDIYEDTSYRENLNYQTDPRYLKYKNLFQVALNDKSELLEHDQDFTIRDELRDIELVTPTIDYANKEITFNFNMGIIDYETGLDFDITKANLPFRAFIADMYSQAKYPGITDNQFITALRNERDANPDRVSSQLYPPDLSLKFADYPAVFEYLNGKYNLISQTHKLEIGTFRSYSEAALASNILMNLDFTYTDYKVYINFIKPSNINVRATTYSINGGNNVTIPTNNTITTAISNNIRINHLDSSNPKLLNQGADISEFVKLYYQDTSTLVDPQYYRLETTPVDNNGNFSTTIVFNSPDFVNQLKGETYLIGYKYSNNDYEKYIRINHSKNTENNILKLKQRGVDETLVSPATNFTTNVPLLYNLDFNLDKIITEHQISSDPNYPAYLNNKYYTVGLLDNIEISAFASISNITISANYTPAGLPQGYIRYTVTYVVTSESGSSKTYTHTINETPVSLIARYINGAITYAPELTAEREAEETTFEFLYDVDDSYKHIFYNLDNTLDTYIEVVGPNTFDDTRYQVSDVLTIIMLAEDLPNNYNFNIYLRRKISATSYITIDLGMQTIKKLPGTSSYLNNIAFGEAGTELSYPEIQILMSNLNTPLLYGSDNTNPEFENYNNSYDPFVYYAGIDYNNADNHNQHHIRVIGEVDNVNLNEFLPRMTEFLPIGSTIQRLIYVPDPNNPGSYLINYTNPVNASSSESDIATLAADYTAYPTNQLEPGESDDTAVVITYVVTSEDGLSKTYYYVSVVDATYNVTFIFDVYYKDSNGIVTNVNDLPMFYLFPMRFQTTVMNTGEQFYEFRPPSNFPNFTQVNKFESHLSLYYQPLSTANYGNYTFRFARNRAGFYQFILDIPNTFTYTMSYDGVELADVSSYVSGIEGKYFYINQGIRTRTRRITVIIEDNLAIPGWGLTQNNATYYQTD